MFTKIVNSLPLFIILRNLYFENCCKKSCRYGGTKIDNWCKRESRLLSRVQPWWVDHTPVESHTIQRIWAAPTILVFPISKGHEIFINKY